MTTAPNIQRAKAEELASPFPALLASAQALAGTVLLGDHGRRRAGMGDDFWQYRLAQPGDPARRIDWRRSARSDQQFIREREWKVAQSVILWVDQGASMNFRGSGRESKLARARVLALACSILLLRAGERVGLTGFSLPPRSGRAQIERLAEALSLDDTSDFSAPEARGMLPHSRALFVSDFFGQTAPLEAALAKAADRGVKGVLLMILDPQEENFPFSGRTRFESMAGGIQFETQQAHGLRGAYQERLAARKDKLQALASAAGWQFHVHHTDASAQSSLMWLYGAMEAA